MLQVTLIGLVAGVLGTGAGGLLVALLGRPSNRVYSPLLGFSGGIMLAVAFLELLPEAIELGGVAAAGAGLVVGAVMIALLDRFLPHGQLAAGNDSRFMRVGLLIGLGIALHNLPEGLAIGAGMQASSSLGLAVAMLIMLHNIPEGMAMGSPMILSGMRRGRMVLLVALAGVPMGFGAAVGYRLGQLSPGFLALSLGLAAGAMLFIIIDELVPAAQELGSGYGAASGAVAGVLVGMVAQFFLAGG